VTISRAQMGRQLKGNTMKKPAPKFKPCASCPNPTKCRAMGKCMKKSGKK
jgi:hypothetical protein